MRSAKKSWELVGAQSKPQASAMSLRLFSWLALILLIGAPPAAWSAAKTNAASLELPAKRAVRIAIIGDYGDGSQQEGQVAKLVKSWTPDYVVTVGDNNYPSGAASTIDRNIGRFYHEYIGDYQGKYGPGAATNHFFPTLGNHDWDARKAVGLPPGPYVDYFTLPDGPGNERYYDVALGPVHIFAVDSDYREPDGSDVNSKQAAWLKQHLAAATEPWKLVVMHEPPYSSGLHGSTARLRWPYQQWGATAVLSGHDHSYERVMRDGFPYIVNGLGGESRYWFVAPVGGSAVRYSGSSGAMLIEATEASITFRFIDVQGDEIDRFTIQAPAPTPTATPPPPAASLMSIAESDLPGG